LKILQLTQSCHCEERSDEAIHLKTSLLDCFAALANFSSTESMTDTFVIVDTMTTNHRHCEERSDEAIHLKTSLLDCFAALAITDAFVDCGNNDDKPSSFAGAQQRNNP
jgi:hypothetical protein